MKFSLVLNHSPWKPERVQAKAAMLLELLPLSSPCVKDFLLHDHDYRGRDWQGGAKRDWILAQWRWAAAVDADFAIFMTDDLHLVPGFWPKLAAMVEASGGEHAIGLLSNHPAAPSLAAMSDGPPFYATNSWLVGPAYVLPGAMLAAILEAYEALPDAGDDGADMKPDHVRGKTGPDSWNDDNFINHWISSKGPGRTLHPIPTLIEHRDDVDSTVGHGDEHSRERISWRAQRSCVEAPSPKGFAWRSEPAPARILAADLGSVDFWNGNGGAKNAPLLDWPTRSESIAPITLRTGATP